MVEKFGVSPASIPDYLALVGDAADGYPGLPGGARNRRRQCWRSLAHRSDPGDCRDGDVNAANAGALAATLVREREQACYSARWRRCAPTSRFRRRRPVALDWADAGVRRTGSTTGRGEDRREAAGAEAWEVGRIRVVVGSFDCVRFAAGAWVGGMILLGHTTTADPSLRLRSTAVPALRFAPVGMTIPEAPPLRMARPTEGHSKSHPTNHGVAMAAASGDCFELSSSRHLTARRSSSSKTLTMSFMRSVIP